MVIDGIPLLTIVTVRDGDSGDNEADDEDCERGLSGSDSSDGLIRMDDRVLGFLEKSRKAIPTLECTRLKVRTSS